MQSVLAPSAAAAFLNARDDDPPETFSANRAWELDRTLILERSEHRAWCVAIAGLVLGLIGIAAVFVQGPLRRAQLSGDGERG